MSFQDFGKNSNNQRRAQGATGTFQSKSTGTGASSSPWSGGASFGSSSQSSSIGQISESLSQYQRHVAILEKLVQQIIQSPASKSGPNSELGVQYQAQVDVVRQLEQRVRGQLQSNKNSGSSTNTTMDKLERDFARVQATAQGCRAKVTRHQKNIQSQSRTALEQDSTMNGPNSLKQDQERYQLQLQQDRLQEEIMREREEEIRNINRGMHQVNEIYKDLAHLVSSQQEQVDQIEVQMEEAKANAESGLGQVQKANDKYNSSQCTIS